LSISAPFIEQAQYRKKTKDERRETREKSKKEVHVKLYIRKAPALLPGQFLRSFDFALTGYVQDDKTSFVSRL
jgi:hypothetical protein